MIRKRAWRAFRTSFSKLSPRDDDHDVNGGGGDASKGGANLCQAVVLCCNRKTTHRSLLHSLCDIPPDSSPPPPDVIRLVASACPQSLSLREAGSDRTPLHLALAQGASLNTIKSLVEAADSSKRRDLLMSLDSKTQTPLVLAIRCGVDDDIVKYMVDQDADGSSLLFSAPPKSNSRKVHAGFPLKYVASRESIFVGEGLDNPEDLLRFMILRTYRAKLRKKFPLLNQNTVATEGGDRANNEQNNIALDNDANTCLLQATIFCYQLIGSSKIASSIVSFIIRNGLFHRERLDSRQDIAGNLTLHIACHSDTPKFDQILKLGDRETDYGLNSEDCTVMEYLINANPPPRTVPYLSRNFEGEIPLHCAIRSGKDWSQIQILIEACPSSVRAPTAKGELPLHLAIKCGNDITSIMGLWNHYPEAASAVDGATFLHPFQLAAIFGSKRQSPRKGKPRKKTRSMDDAHQKDEWDETSLSFFMLRGCPSLLSSSL